jgi:hypothetical protein
MKTRLDKTKVARGLGAKRKGKVPARGGYFGALQLAAEIEARFRVPPGGGRSTDPQWTERRQVPFSPHTLERLWTLATALREDCGASIEPMQLAALLLEKTTEQLSTEDARDLLRPS